MVGFPFRIVGKLEFDPLEGAEADPAQALDVIESELRKLSPSSLVRSGIGLTFRGGILRPVMNWNLLVPISIGRLEVTKESISLVVTYDLSLVELFVVAALVIGVFGVPIWLADGLTATAKVAVLTFLWFALFGGNYVIAAFRFPRFVRGSLSKHDRPGK